MTDAEAVEAIAPFLPDLRREALRAFRRMNRRVDRFFEPLDRVMSIPVLALTLDAYATGRRLVAWRDGAWVALRTYGRRDGAA